MRDIVVNFCGDFVAKDPSLLQFSSSLQSAINRGDINVVNFEAPISGIGVEAHRSGPKVCQSPSSCAFLKSNGFNLFQLANNHAVDFGEDACLATKQMLVNTVGAGTEEEAFSPVIKEINGKKIGFLSFVHHEFGVFDDSGNEQRIGTAWICSHKAIAAIITTKRLVDFLIVLTHAGVEQVDLPLPEWRSLYRSFVDFGADAIIGTHPHVPQGWEIYKDKPIFYSLGNFYFDAIMPSDEWWYKGLMVSLFLNETGIQYSVFNTKFKKGTVCIDETKQTNEHNAYLCSILNNEQEYFEGVNRIVLTKWKELEVYYVRGIGAVSLRLPFIECLKSIYCALFRKPNESLLINALQCESHRFVALRAQKLLNK